MLEVLEIDHHDNDGEPTDVSSGSENDDSSNNSNSGNANSDDVQALLAAIRRVSVGTMLHGRHEEKLKLKHCWEFCCAERRKQMVVISGRAGSGKSRLVGSLRPLLNNKKCIGSNWGGSDCITTTTTPQRSFYVSGKFSQSTHFCRGNNHQAPYEVFVTAFSSFVGQLLDCGDANLISRCKQAVCQAIHKERRNALFQLIPAFAQLCEGVGSTPPPPEAAPEASARGMSHRSVESCSSLPGAAQTTTRVYGSEAANRLKNAFSDVVVALCSCTPLLLCLDDVQWIDTASLDLLQCLLQNSQQVPLMVVATIRSSTAESKESSSGGSSSSCGDFESSNSLLATTTSSNNINNNNSSTGGVSLAASASSLARTRKRAFQTFFKHMKRDESIRVVTIHLTSLRLEHVRELVAHVLDQNDKDARHVLRLAALVHEQTRGNVFHIFQFLRLLVVKGILIRHSSQAHGGWTWQDEALDSEEFLLQHSIVESIPNLVVRTIQDLPVQVQEALKMASCLGDELDGSALDRVLLTHSAPLLQQAAEQGLLVFDSHVGGFRFAHDLIRHASFSLIDRDDLPQFYLTLGQRLWRSSSPAALDANIMLIVSLMNEGCSLITQPKERYKVAELNWKAAVKAMSLPSFPDAAVFLRRGIDCLGPHCWEERYQLCLDLYSHAAEAEMHNGNYDVVAPFIDQVVIHGAALDDKLHVYATLLKCMELQGDGHEATSICIHVLRELGERLPTRPSKLAAFVELARTRMALRGKTADDLLALPQMTNRRKMQCMEFLSIGCMISTNSRSPLSAIFACRSVLLTLRHGITGYSAPAFSVYAMMLCGLRVDVKGGHAMGKIAMAIAERDNSARMNTWTHLLLGSGILHWSRPIQETMNALKYSSRLGMETGYVVPALRARLTEVLVDLLFVGKKLVNVKKEIQAAARLARLYRQQKTERTLMLLQQIINLYEGGSDTYQDDDSESLEREISVFEHRFSESVHPMDKIDQLLFYLCCMELCYMCKDYVNAKRLALLCVKNQKGPSPGIVASVCPFACAMVGFALCRQQGATFVNPNWRFARTHAKTVARFAKDSPANFVQMDVLARAEMTSIRSSHREAAVCALFAEAFGAAKEQHNLKLMALSCEKYGDYLASRGKRAEASVQLTKAANLYEDWGAQVKCKMLRDSVDRLEDGLTKKRGVLNQ